MERLNTSNEEIRRFERIRISLLAELTKILIKIENDLQKELRDIPSETKKEEVIRSYERLMREKIREIEANRDGVAHTISAIKKFD